MPQHNEENERIKRRYFTYLREARRYSEPSVEAAAMAIDRFDTFHGRRSFRPSIANALSPSSGSWRTSAPPDPVNR